MMTNNARNSPVAQWLTPGRFAAILGLMIFAAFPQVVTGTHSFAYRDYGLFGYPLAHYFKDSFWRGEMPLWNPYSEFGLPFLAQWNTMVLYPPSLIYLLLPMPWSLGLFCLLHLFGGGMGMYALTERWTANRLAAGIAGVTFAFSGLVLNCLMWPNYTASLALMPWVILVMTRAWEGGGRQIIVAALVGSLQMLSGTPEVILFTWLVVAALWVCTRVPNWDQARKSFWQTMAVVGLVSALCAAQLLPFFELLSLSQREATFEKGHWPVPVWGWANLFVPMFRVYATGCGVHFQYNQMFTSSTYSGIFTMVLVTLAVMWMRDRRAWLFAGLALLSLVLAMGQKAGLYSLLKTGVPQIGFMRYSSKFVMLLCFVLPVLAAFGFSALLSRVGASPEARSRPVLVLGLVSFAVILVIAGIVMFARFIPFPAQDWSKTLTNGLTRAGLVVALGAAVMTLLRMQGHHRQWLLQCLILLLVWVDLMSHVPNQNPTLDRGVLTTPVPRTKLSPAPKLGESRSALTIDAMNAFRLASSSNLTQMYLALRMGLFANANMVEKIPKADGFFALSIREGRDASLRLFRTELDPREPLARFVGISHVTSPTNRVAWASRTNYLPMVTAGQRPVFTTQPRALGGIMATNFAPESVVYLPEEARDVLRATNESRVRVVATTVTEHRVTARVAAEEPSLVVLAQAFYPGWRAYVDGKPAPLLRANYAFQAVEVGAGEHQVEVVYEDRMFRLGSWLTLAGALSCGLGWWRLRGKAGAA